MVARPEASESGRIEAILDDFAGELSRVVQHGQGFFGWGGSRWATFFGDQSLANRNRSTHLKRQRERALLERREEKARRLAQRRADRAAGILPPEGEGDSDLGTENEGNEGNEGMEGNEGSSEIASDGAEVSEGGAPASSDGKPPAEPGR